MLSCGNPTLNVMEKVRGQEDEEITKRERTKQWHGLRDKLSGSILDISRGCVQASPTRQAGVPASEFLCLGQCRTAPVDSLSSDAFPLSPSWGQHCSRICQDLAEGMVRIADEPSLLVFPLLTINSLISPSGRQHVLSHPVEHRGTVSPEDSVPDPTLLQLN